MILLMQIFSPRELSYILLAAGTIGIYLIRRRRFNRRVFYRTYAYRSFLLSLIIPFIEFLLMLISLLSFGAGLFIFIWE